MNIYINSINYEFGVYKEAHEDMIKIELYGNGKEYEFNFSSKSYLNLEEEIKYFIETQVEQ